MTLPSEKTNALKNARQFLYKILWRPRQGGFAKIPLEVRKLARGALKHYPQDYEIDQITKCKKCGKILGKD